MRNHFVSGFAQFCHCNGRFVRWRIVHGERTRFGMPISTVFPSMRHSNSTMIPRSGLESLVCRCSGCRSGLLSLELSLGLSFGLSQETVAIAYLTIPYPPIAPSRSSFCSVRFHQSLSMFWVGTTLRTVSVRVR